MEANRTLEDVANEYVTQDNRCTRFPYALLVLEGTSYNKGKQMFLTESSAKNYIERHKHKIVNPRTYGIYVEDNHDMELLIRELMKKATLPIEEWNHEARRYFLQEVLKVK